MVIGIGSDPHSRLLSRPGFFIPMGAACQNFAHPAGARRNVRFPFAYFRAFTRNRLNCTDRVLLFLSTVLVAGTIALLFAVAGPEELRIHLLEIYLHAAPYEPVVYTWPVGLLHLTDYRMFNYPLTVQLAWGVLYLHRLLQGYIRRLDAYDGDLHDRKREAA